MCLLHDLILRGRQTDDSDHDGVAEDGSLGKENSGLDRRLYALQDANWNVTALVSTSGVVLERFIYDAYGNGKVLSDTFSETSDAWEVPGTQTDIDILGRIWRNPSGQSFNSE